MNAFTDEVARSLLLYNSAKLAIAKDDKRKSNQSRVGGPLKALANLDIRVIEH